MAESQARLRARRDAPIVNPVPGVFAHRDYRRQLISLFLGSLAIQIQSIAVSWRIYAITRSPLALGYAGLFEFLPMVVCTLPAGSVADRFDRRLIVVISYIVQAVAASLFLGLAITDRSVVWPFYAVLALFGAARTFVGPAAQSLVPLLVPQEQFPQAVAWNSSTFQTAVIAGPALGGMIYALSPTAPYAIGMVLFAIVAAVMATITYRSPRHPEETGMTGLRRLTAGIAYVSSRPMILGAISLDLFAVLLGGATAMLPVYARDILHVGPGGLGLLRSAPAAGAALVGISLGRWPLGGKAGRKMFACVAIFGLATIVFGLSDSFVVSLAALAVVGASDMVSVYVRQTLTQLATPDPMRGRVSAVNRLFIGTSNELGAFESGVTAAWFGTVPSVVIGGIGTLIVVGLGIALFPSLRAIDRLADVTPDP
jgi:MFS family permease